MIENQANDPSRTSWIPVPENSDFPIQNLPFGVFIPGDDIITTGTRIGDTAIDLSALQQLGYFNGIDLPDDVFLQDTLNDFIADGRKTWRLVRNRIAQIFDIEKTQRTELIKFAGMFSRPNRDEFSRRKKEISSI